MKYIIIFLTIIPCTIMAQSHQDSLRDRVWVLGYNSAPPSNFTEHVLLDFNNDSLKITGHQVADGLIMDYTNSSICERDGSLYLFTNGCSIGDSTGNKIANLENINIGDFQDYICENLHGNPYPNTTLILPMNPDTAFRIFYLQTKKNLSNEILGFKLLETKVKKNVSGQTTAIYTDKLILDGDLYIGNITSTRHANGRDWWLICPERISGYYKFLICPDTIIAEKQIIGASTIKWEDSSGEACFSPDGSKFARYTISTDIQIFNFDRCIGEFSNPIHIPIVDAADTSYAAGLAFSPSGRFLYISSTSYIYQFDTEALDIENSRITVANYDGFTIHDLPTGFYQCELGPDNKIYIGCPGGKEVIHVIEYPDLLGINCQVNQHKYILPYPIHGGLPNFPNFHLGPLVGSGCDTIVFTETKEVVAGKESSLDFVLYPNPTNNTLTIDLLDNLNFDAEYLIYNSMGIRVGGDNLTKKITQLSVGQLSTGIYNVVVRLHEGITAVKRFQIIR
jgi:hypothetical protein